MKNSDIKVEAVLREERAKLDALSLEYTRRIAAHHEDIVSQAQAKLDALNADYVRRHHERQAVLASCVSADSEISALEARRKELLLKATVEKDEAAAGELRDIVRTIDDLREQIRNAREAAELLTPGVDAAHQEQIAAARFLAREKAVIPFLLHRRKTEQLEAAFDALTSLAHEWLATAAALEQAHQTAFAERTGLEEPRFLLARALVVRMRELIGPDHEYMMARTWPRETRSLAAPLTALGNRTEPFRASVTGDM